jgi:uncharacterized protein YjiS (DUF1127 family)
MTTSHNAAHQAVRPRRTIRQTAAAAWGTLARVAEVIATWLRRSAERRHLHSLNDYMLKDMGVSRADVERETSKRCWQD